MVFSCSQGDVKVKQVEKIKFCVPCSVTNVFRKNCLKSRLITHNKDTKTLNTKTSPVQGIFHLNKEKFTLNLVHFQHPYHFSNNKKSLFSEAFNSIRARCVFRHYLLKVKDTKTLSVNFLSSGLKTGSSANAMASDAINILDSLITG